MDSFSLGVTLSWAVTFAPAPPADTAPAQNPRPPLPPDSPAAPTAITLICVTPAGTAKLWLEPPDGRNTVVSAATDGLALRPSAPRTTSSDPAAARNLLFTRLIVSPPPRP